MTRAISWIGAVAVCGFAAGILTTRFGANIQEVKRGRNAPAARTVPAEWRKVRLSPGHSQHVINERLECDECHDPTLKTFESPDTGVCTECHEEQASLAHVDSDGMPMNCYTCHLFSSDPEVVGRWNCRRCHGPFQSDAGEGLSMHNTVPCENCHNPHKPIEETVLDCGECHEAVKLRHGDPARSGSCRDCHGGHRDASEATACLHCHGTREPKIPSTATFAGGHESCAQCHKPHSFSASTAPKCRSCHEDQVVLGQAEVAAHRDCMSCHQPHAANVVPDTTCKRCHKAVAPTHPRGPNGNRCTGCHDPHPERAARVAARCSECHTAASSDRAFHAADSGCTDCHRPHRFDLSRFTDRALCGRCHTAQVHLTRRNLGHASCQGCHQGVPHQLGAPADCVSCHVNQPAKSPAGHRQCLKCHEPHSGLVAIKSCGDCHDLGALPGLHQVADTPPGEGHRKCTVCHSAHIPAPRADRATCMTCHQDRGSHEPDARRCTGCHTFRSAKPN